TQIIYPPCPVREFSSIKEGKRSLMILSIAQFRPEKNHRLQLQAFSHFLSLLSLSPLSKSIDGGKIRLVLAGGVRDEKDRERVRELREMAVSLSIADQVQFELNC